MRHLLSAGLIACALPVAAQERCAPYQSAVASLAAGYGEMRAFAGDSARADGTIELWLNPTTGTWTIIAVRPDGMACALDDGTVAKPAQQPGQDG